MINLKIALKPHAPRMRPHPFPSQLLIITNIVSCFLSTVAFTLSLAQIGTRHSMIVIPNLIGFFLTIPYHGHLYVCAQRHLEIRRNTPHSAEVEAIITPPRIVAAFLLVSGWVLILLINILFSLKAAPGAIMTTIVGGLEMFTLFFIAIRSSQESWEAESADPGDRAYGGELRTQSLPIMSRLIYLLSFVLCTVCLVLSVGSYFFIANMVAFVVTVPYHLTIFIDSGKSRPLVKALPSQIRSIILSFVLVALWCFAFALDIICDGILIQKIVSAVFGGLECIIAGYVAIRGVLENLEVESQVKLP